MNQELLKNQDKEVAHIFEIICKGWEGSAMLFPLINKNGERVNVQIYLKDMLKPIAEAVDTAKNYTYTKTPL